MRQVIGWMLVGCAIASAAGAQAPLRDRLRAQLERDAQAGFAYRKHAMVTTDPAANPTWEVREFTVASGRMRAALGADTSSRAFIDELYDALRYSYDQATIADQFERGRSGDTLVARARPASRTDLREQRVVLGADGRLRYVACTLVNESTLYRTESQVAVSFDAEGHYARHSLSIVTRLKLLGSPRVVRIRGERR